MKQHTHSKLALTFVLGAAWVLGGCSTRYVQIKGDPSVDKSALTNTLAPEVSYRIETANWAPAPTCIAVLPVSAPDADKSKLELVRRGLYAHLAPKGYRLAEMHRVDDWLARQPAENRQNRAALGKDLQCGHLLETDVITFEKGFFAIFSKVKLGAKARLIRASDGALLWQAEHTAELQDGGLPISPIGAASGVFSAGRNLADEQTYRVVDDLSRRLLNTLPDGKPVAELVATTEKPLPPDWKTDLDGWIANRPEIDREAALHELARRADLDAIQQEGIFRRLTAKYDKPRYWREWAQARLERDDPAGALELVRQAQKQAPNETETDYLTARIFTRLGRLEDADASIVSVIARAGENAEYYETLANISLRRGLTDRARAALEKIIRIDATRPYPWYNLAVMDFNAGQYNAALDGFVTAARRYIDRGQWARAERIIQEIDELRPHLGASTLAARQDTLRAALQAAKPAASPSAKPTEPPPATRSTAP